jgi:hypothetical protein
MNHLQQLHSFAVDHVFICTHYGAPGAQRLIELGFTEGPPNTHPGQGTANRRFFFRSTMLELLWVADEAAAHSGLTRPTLLWDRWSGRRGSACPFGIVLRAAATVAPPFAAWEYKPSYLPPGDAMLVASEAGLEDPMWVYLPFLKAASRTIGHAIGVDEITSVRLTSPLLPQMAVSRSLAEMGVIALASGPAYLLELEFDAGVNGLGADFRPDLPLAIRW